MDGSWGEGQKKEIGLPMLFRLISTLTIGVEKGNEYEF